MNHTELSAQSTLKFASHTALECDGAIADIHATFAAQGPSISKEYEAKLYSELDAARDRKLKLSRVRSRTGAVDLCIDMGTALVQLEQTGGLDGNRVRGLVLRYQEWSKQP